MLRSCFGTQSPHSNLCQMCAEKFSCMMQTGINKEKEREEQAKTGAICSSGSMCYHCGFSSDCGRGEGMHKCKNPKEEYDSDNCPETCEYWEECCKIWFDS